MACVPKPKANTVSGGDETKNSALITKIKESFDQLESHRSTWNVIFLISYVIAIAGDPFFFYIPVIDEDRKCLGMDHKLKISALILRSITDIFCLLHIIFQVRNISREEEKSSTLASSRKSITCFIDRWKYIIIVIWILLPLPQVLILFLYSNMWCSSNWTAMTFVNVIVLLQYVPRILRIYHSAMELKRSYDSLLGLVWVKGALNLALYINASHVLGAFWYYFAIQRETTCWQNACRNHEGCDPSAFSCHVNDTSRDVKFLKDFCPVNPPNAAKFDFGIFADAPESGMVGTLDFPKKCLQCFWWGLQNLSSFGQNLETSSKVWEICFAVFITISGLLLFLYLIGNLQTYMQLATTRSYENRRKIKHKEADINLWMKSIRKERPDVPEENTMRTVILDQLVRSLEKEEDLDLEFLLLLLEEGIKEEKKKIEEAELRKMCMDIANYFSEHKSKKGEMKISSAKSWMSANGFDKKTKKQLKQHLLRRLEDVQDVNLVDFFSVLPDKQRTITKEHLCGTMVDELLMPKMCQIMDLRIHAMLIHAKDGNKDVKEAILDHLKPVTYKENSYIIQEKEPLDFILFITNGVAWRFGGNNAKVDHLEKGKQHGGAELLDWQLSTKESPIPIAEKQVKSHTRIEGFVLKAVHLQKIIPNNEQISLQKIPDDAKEYKSFDYLESGLKQVEFYVAKRAWKHINKMNKRDIQKSSESGRSTNRDFNEDKCDSSSLTEEKGAGSSSTEIKYDSGFKMV